MDSILVVVACRGGGDWQFCTMRGSSSTRVGAGAGAGYYWTFGWLLETVPATFHCPGCHFHPRVMVVPWLYPISQTSHFFANFIVEGSHLSSESAKFPRKYTETMRRNCTRERKLVASHFPRKMNLMGIQVPDRIQACPLQLARHLHPKRQPSVTSTSKDFHTLHKDYYNSVSQLRKRLHIQISGNKRPPLGRGRTRRSPLFRKQATTATTAMPASLQQ